MPVEADGSSMFRLPEAGALGADSHSFLNNLKLYMDYSMHRAS